MENQAGTKIYEVTLSNGEAQYFRGTEIQVLSNGVTIYNGDREVGSARNNLAWKEHADDGSISV